VTYYCLKFLLKMPVGDWSSIWMNYMSSI
jgi:hypothetical protein